MAKIEASSTPDGSASLSAQPGEPERARPEDPTRLVDQGPGQPKRAAKDLDDNWALSASLAVPRVTGVTDVAPDPEGATIPTPSPEAPTVAAGSAPRQPLSRAALRLLAGKTIQGVAPVVGQRRPAEGTSPSGLRGEQDVRFSQSGPAPMYLEEGPGVLRLSTETSEVSVQEIDAGTSATTVLAPEKRASSPYGGDDDRDPHDDSGIGELAEPPPPVAASMLHSDTLDQDADEHDEPAEPPMVGHALAGMPPPALKAPTALAPAIALGAPRRPYANELVGDGGRREADWFEPSGPVQVSEPGRGAAHLDHSFTGGASRKVGSSRLTLPLLVFAAVSAVVFAGAYVYSRGRSAPPPPPVTTELGTAQTPPAPEDPVGGLIDVRFDSTPPGAAVVLRDRQSGATSAVGATPIRAAIDARAKYDALFTLPGHSTRLLPVSPASPHVVADFSVADAAAVAAAQESGAPDVVVVAETGPVAAVAAAEPGNAPGGELGKAPGAVAGAPEVGKPSGELAPTDKKNPPAVTADKRDGGKRVGGKRVRPRGEGNDEEEDEDEPVRNVDPSAIGRLSISTKPPCQILINGKASGTTPLRDLQLPAGIYKITVVNKELSLNETIAVRVTAGKETKFTQDYTGAAE